MTFNFSGTNPYLLHPVAHTVDEAMPLVQQCFAETERHDEIPKLSVHRQALAAIPNLGIQVLPITPPHIEAATVFSNQHELLIGDGLILAVMQAHGLTNLASNDADFDRVPGLTRYAPV